MNPTPAGRARQPKNRHPRTDLKVGHQEGLREASETHRSGAASRKRRVQKERRFAKRKGKPRELFQKAYLAVTRLVPEFEP